MIEDFWKAKLAESERDTKLVHVVRSDVNWRTMNKRRFLNQNASHFMELCKRVMAPNKSLDTTFSRSYFWFRYKLKRIAFHNWQQCDFDLRIKWKHVRRFIDVIQEDCFLIMSDDDWFHPELGKRLEKTTSDFCAWDDFIFKDKQVAIRPAKRSDWIILWTNNWALKASCFRKFPPKAFQKLKYHITAMPVLFGEVYRRSNKVLTPGRMDTAKFKFEFFDETYSGTNKTMASLTNLRKLVSQSDVEKRQILQRQLYDFLTTHSAPKCGMGTQRWSR